MTTKTLLGSGWPHAKKYLLAACAVAALNAGLFRALSIVVYPSGTLAVKLINFIIRRDFPDHLLLNPYAAPPWQDQVRTAAEGVIVLVIGMFLGLWANSTARRQKSP